MTDEAKPYVMDEVDTFTGHDEGTSRARIKATVAERDALRARIAGAESDANVETVRGLRADLATAAGVAAELRARNEELVAALEAYGVHRFKCPRRGGLPPIAAACSCGLSAALSKNRGGQ